MVIAIANHKGGTAKTTTTLNLGEALNCLDKKVLLIDLDPQANLTYSLDLIGYPTTITHLFTQQLNFDDVVIKMENDIDVITSSIELADVELNINQVYKREFILANILAQARNNYDYVLIDCSPSISLLVTNALCAADEVIIPTQMEVLAVKGLTQFLTTAENIRTTWNPNLHVLGVLPVMLDFRKKLTSELLQYLEENEVPMFKNGIRTNIKISEAPSFGESVIAYSNSSNGAQDYMALASEVVEKVEQEELVN